jgi:hypothetical protein
MKVWPVEAEGDVDPTIRRFNAAAGSFGKGRSIEIDSGLGRNRMFETLLT